MLFHNTICVLKSTPGIPDYTQGTCQHSWDLAAQTLLHGPSLSNFFIWWEVTNTLRENCKHISLLTQWFVHTLRKGVVEEKHMISVRLFSELQRKSAFKRKKIKCKTNTTASLQRWASIHSFFYGPLRNQFLNLKFPNTNGFGMTQLTNPAMQQAVLASRFIIHRFLYPLGKKKKQASPRHSTPRIQRESSHLLSTIASATTCAILYVSYVD